MKLQILAAAAIFLTGSASAVPFNFVGTGGVNVDVPSPGTSFTINATGLGAITDLNFAVHLFNMRTNVPPPIFNTMAWGDLDVTLSKDGITVPLWFNGNPGETSDLFVSCSMMIRLSQSRSTTCSPPAFAEFSAVRYRRCRHNPSRRASSQRSIRTALPRVISPQVPCPGSMDST